MTHALPAIVLGIVRWFWRHQSARGYLELFVWLLAASWISAWLRWIRVAPGLEDAAWVAILISVTLYAWRALRDGRADATLEDHPPQ